MCLRQKPEADGTGRWACTYDVKHQKPFEQWEVLIKEHHEDFIDWSEFERNQKLLAANTYGKADGAKSDRGVPSLLTGVLLCGRCGRRLKVACSGRALGQPVYRCELPNQMFGRPRCLIFGATRVDAAIALELLRALEPMAIDAALQAERRHMELQGERRRIVQLELQQAQYEASLAERRYAGCDLDYRLIAARLEKSWEATLQRVKACEERLATLETPGSTGPVPDFVGLANNFEATWNTPSVTMRSRQQLLRALITEIIADYDESSREIILTIHWRGQHSELRVPKPRSGEHGCRTTDEAVAVIETMATRLLDAHIAATLKRMGLPAGQGKPWTATRVSSLRRVRGINAHRLAERMESGSPCRKPP